METGDGVQDLSVEHKGKIYLLVDTIDDYQLDMKTISLQSKKKQEEKEQYKSIMKKVITNAQVA